MFVTVRDDPWALPGVRAVSALVLASGEMTGAWGGAAAAAWSAHTTGAFTLRVYPGGHFHLDDCRA